MSRARIAVRLKPRSSRAGVLAFRDGRLHVAVREPPVDGKANAALIEVVARVLDVPRSRVTLVAGQTGRDKRLEVAGMTETELVRRLTEG